MLDCYVLHCSRKMLHLWKCDIFHLGNIQRCYRLFTSDGALYSWACLSRRLFQPPLKQARHRSYLNYMTNNLSVAAALGWWPAQRRPFSRNRWEPRRPGSCRTRRRRWRRSTGWRWSTEKRREKSETSGLNWMRERRHEKSPNVKSSTLEKS